MRKIDYVKLIDISSCYDKMSRKEISWRVAISRLNVGLKHTFWVVIDSKRLK